MHRTAESSAGRENCQTSHRARNEINTSVCAAPNRSERSWNWFINNKHVARGDGSWVDSAPSCFLHILFLFFPLSVKRPLLFFMSVDFAHSSSPMQWYSFCPVSPFFLWILRVVIFVLALLLVLVRRVTCVVDREQKSWAFFCGWVEL